MLFLGSVINIDFSKTIFESSAPGCVQPGERSPAAVDPVFIFALPENLGYSKISCQKISKEELLARKFLGCSFKPGPRDPYGRCSLNQSASFYRSFLDTDPNPAAGIDIVKIESKPEFKSLFEKKCPKDCLQEK